MKKAYLKFIVTELVCLVVQLCLSKIELFGFLSPVGLPFAFARLAFGANVLLVALEFFLSKIYSFYLLQNLFISLYQIVFLALFYFVTEIFKPRQKWTVSLIFLTLSQILSLYFSLKNYELLAYFFLNYSCEIFIFLFLYKFFKVYNSKFLFFRFSHREFVLFSVMLLLLSVGVFSFNFIYLWAKYFILILAALVLSRVLPSDKYFVALTVLAVGAFVVVPTDVVPLLVSIVLSIILMQLRDMNKYLCGVVAAIFLGILVFLFKIYSIFNIISTIFAIFLYMVLPNKIFMKLSVMFEGDQSSIIIQSLNEQRLEHVRSKLLLMSETLLSMQRDFKLLLVGKIDRRCASRELADDLIKKCCSTCEGYKQCFFQNIDKRALFENLMSKAIEQGQVEQGDLLLGVQAYCNKSAIAISETNQIAKKFLQYEAAVKSEDASKLMIASELENFSDIFKNLAGTVTPQYFVNEKLSKVLKERLIASMIDAKEVLIEESRRSIESVNIILPNAEVSKRELVELIHKVTKIKMRQEQVEHLNISGLSLLSFCPASRLRVNFAMSSRAKERANGDSATVSKLDKNKYFVAISDGMGHGEGANRISTMVLSLIKSMFEVGLESELILESVNRLLLPAGLDNFTTLDACVIDLELNECIFIKLGSSVSVIKHESSSELISCKSLPMGIVRNIEPTIIKRPISAGDMVFLASDGVVDTFSSVESFKIFINDSKVYNLQKYLDDIVDDAVAASSQHLDDMTIIAINLLKN